MRMPGSSHDPGPSTTQPRTNRPLQGSAGSYRPGACLVVLQGPSLGQRIDLGDQVLTLGRAEGCGLRIDERSVSRQHACIGRNGDAFWLKDLGATNKTLLNDVPIDEAVLSNGDYITIGSCVLKFLARASVEARYHDEIYELATLDPLTGLSNRRHFLEFLERELHRSRRHVRPLVLLIADLDHFKTVNDRFGHVAGDGVLEQVGRVFKDLAHGEAMPARMGGEEFAIALPEHTLEAGAAFAERLRDAIEHMPLQLADDAYSLTVSVGVCAWQPQMQQVSELLARADEALYRAKQDGRNRVKIGSDTFSDARDHAGDSP